MLESKKDNVKEMLEDLEAMRAVKEEVARIREEAKNKK